MHWAALDLAFKLLVFIDKFFQGPLSHKSQWCKQCRIITCGVCVITCKGCVILVNISVLCMFVCVCTLVCVYDCVRKDAYMDGHQMPTLVFGTRYLTRIGASSFARMAAGKPRECSCLCCLSTGIRVTDQGFCECAGARTQAITLAREAIYPESYLPTLSRVFLTRNQLTALYITAWRPSLVPRALGVGVGLRKLG